MLTSDLLTQARSSAVDRLTREIPKSLPPEFFHVSVRSGIDEILEGPPVALFSKAGRALHLIQLQSPTISRWLQGPPKVAPFL